MSIRLSRQIPEGRWGCRIETAKTATKTEPNQNHNIDTKTTPPGPAMHGLMYQNKTGLADVRQ